ncbi:unnamed protein product [Ceratitis capitata]|uniref:(Mediterranean fruit fly) hypothetical protein n=1 Tax=Ceratitis capitata TaxID=7213 RepID=A0A811UP90_CERCA|nr:unnamed protein product [Ceratitis capitata]
MGLQMAGLPAANNYVAITQKTLSATATTNIRCHHRRMPTIQTTTTAIAVTIAIAIANVVRKLNNTISVTSSSISATLLLLLILLTWNPATIGVDAVPFGTGMATNAAVRTERELQYLMQSLA